MSSVAEIQDAIEHLSAKEREVLALWLESKTEPLMTEAEETALLKSLDKAAAELDAGLGHSAEEVRSMVAKWVTK